MKSIIKKIISAILEVESRLIMKKYKPFVITITGSVGKTSTKDAIYTVLSAGAPAGTVRRSEKSFNSELGVPLTILGCENPWGSFIGWIEVISHGIELVLFKSEYPTTLILEVGADHPGDIKRVARWLKPDIAVVTKIGAVPVHIEFFPSRSALVEEKLSLARAIKSEGVLVLPADDAEILAVRKDNNVKAYTYAVNSPADINATSVETIYDGMHSDGTSSVAGAPVGISFRLNHAGNSIPVKVMKVLGIQHVYPLVAACAVGLARGLKIASIIESLSAHEAPKARMNILEGINNSTIIDDTYNASPDAVAEALATLDAVRISQPVSGGVRGRKIVVLGDMMELGKFAQEEHRKAGALVAKVFAGEKAVEAGSTVGELASRNLFVTVGQRAKMMRTGAIEAGMPDSAILSYDTSLEAGPEIAKLVQAGDIILIKGSQSPRLERVTAALLRDPSTAPDVLVRQESEWTAKK